MLIISCLLVLSIVGTIIVLSLSKKDLINYSLKLSYKQNDKDNSFYLLVRIILIPFIISVIIRIINYDAFINVYNLDSLFSPTMDAIIAILRALTMGLTLCYLIVAFFNYKLFTNIVAFFGPIIYVVNIILYVQNIQALLGIVSVPTFNYREIFFGIECTSGLIIGLSFLIRKISLKDFGNLPKQLLYSLLVFILLSIFAMNPSTIENIFGVKWCKACTDFNNLHLLVIFSMIIITIALIVVFKKIKNNDITHCFLAICSICCAISYTYNRNYADFKFWNLPLHLCNTGVFLMLFCFTCKSKPIFYFVYLVSVVGTLFAILLPDYDTAFLSADGIHYWLNHLLLFILPIVAVGSNYYKRPKLKYVYYSIIVFTIYFITVCFIDAWFVNYEPGVNYFYLNGDTIVNRFMWAPHLKNNYILIFSIGNATFNIYWLYWLLTYIIYIGFIFGAWFCYVSLYQISDGYTKLFERINQKNKQNKIFKNQMNGRDKELPLYPDDSSLIRIEHFSKIYSGDTRKAVNDFSLEIYSGEVFGFLGHNGAGKSTTIKSIVGIQTITEGKIEVCGYDLQTQPVMAKSLIGYVSDNHTVYENLTGREYINYVADLYLVPEKERNERIEKYLKMFELEYAIDKEIKGYSHGMKQKIVVISSLIHNPKVWILDEPLTGLDPTSSYQIKNVMREHAKNGNIVFFSSHVIEVVEKICDRIGIISKGKLIGVWKMDEIKNSGMTLQDLYVKYVSSLNKVGDNNA